MKVRTHAFESFPESRMPHFKVKVHWFRISIAHALVLFVLRIKISCKRGDLISIMAGLRTPTLARI